MTENEWNGIAAMMTAAWPSSRWPGETQALYRRKLDGCSAAELASVVDALTESSEFLPSLATILKEFAKRHPKHAGLNGSDCEYGSIAYFKRHYPSDWENEHRAYLEFKDSRRAQLEDGRSGFNGPRRLAP